MWDGDEGAGLVFHPHSGDYIAKPRLIRNTFGFAAEHWYRRHVKPQGAVPWMRNEPRVQAERAEHRPYDDIWGAWCELDALEENLGAMARWAQRYDAYARAASITRLSYCVQLLAACVEAGREVQRAAIPWWRVVQETRLTRGRRKVRLASQVPSWLRE